MFPLVAKLATTVALALELVPPGGRAVSVGRVPPPAPFIGAVILPMVGLKKINIKTCKKPPSSNNHAIRYKKIYNKNLKHLYLPIGG